jgi:hypothetical protein
MATVDGGCRIDLIQLKHVPLRFPTALRGHCNIGILAFAFGYRSASYGFTLLRLWAALGSRDKPICWLELLSRLVD